MKTTLYTVLCVAIRLGAVFMAVGILETLPQIFFLPGEGGRFATFVLLLEGAGLLLAFALWLWPNILVWWAIGRNRHEILESSISADQLQHIALSVLGAWMFIGGLSACLSRAVMILVVKNDNMLGMLPTGEWRWLIQYAATAVAGAALTLGSRGLVGLLHRLRGYPQYTSVEANADTSNTQDG